MFSSTGYKSSLSDIFIKINNERTVVNYDTSYNI